MKEFTKPERNMPKATISEGKKCYVSGACTSSIVKSQKTGTEVLFFQLYLSSLVLPETNYRYIKTPAILQSVPGSWFLDATKLAIICSAFW